MCVAAGYLHSGCPTAPALSQRPTAARPLRVLRPEPRPKHFRLPAVTLHPVRSKLRATPSISSVSRLSTECSTATTFLLLRSKLECLALAGTRHHSSRSLPRRTCFPALYTSSVVASARRERGECFDADQRRPKRCERLRERTLQLSSGPSRRSRSRCVSPWLCAMRVYLLLSRATRARRASAVPSLPHMPLEAASSGGHRAAAPCIMLHFGQPFARHLAPLNG